MSPREKIMRVYSLKNNTAWMKLDLSAMHHGFTSIGDALKTTDEETLKSIWLQSLTIF